MSHRRVPSWQKAKRPGHRMPRAVKRERATPHHGHRLTLWLWSANGETVAKLEAWGSADQCPPLCVHDGVRFDKVPRQSSSAKVVHYQTAAILPRAVA